MFERYLEEKRIYNRQKLSFIIFIAFSIFLSTPSSAHVKPTGSKIVNIPSQNLVRVEPVAPIVEEKPITPDEKELENSVIVEEDTVETPMLSNEEIELIALVVMAEAEGESEEGKRLVIDTILNRVDGKYWPNTVNGVIYQANQFTSMWNGRVNRCYVKEDICQLVREELQSRTNTEVVFFTAGGYGRYGTPMFQVGNHYFCKY
jgi:N-acetylmuramoyl-L-alanine amidase